MLAIVKDATYPDCPYKVASKFFLAYLYDTETDLHLYVRNII